MKNMMYNYQVDKKQKVRENIHSGHRARLVSLVSKAGLENLSDVQALEFVLTYIFPRGDVNPLAHKLLEKFGNFASVLDADPIELETVEGIGPRAAILISQLPEIFNLYSSTKLNSKILAKDFSDVIDYAEQLLRFKNFEEFYIVGLDSSSKIISRRKLASGSINKVGILPLDITKFVASCKAVMVFITHNHPGGSARASSQDTKATEIFENLCTSLGITFIDHLIVGSDGVYSYKYKSMVRNFI